MTTPAGEQPSHPRAIALAPLALVLGGCPGHPTTPTSSGGPGPVIVDRFSDAAGHLMKRSGNAALPPPGAPIDFDRPPFITQGLGPDGKPVRYYNFDVQPDVPAPLYRITRAGTRAALEHQPDLVDAIPGSPGYSDFWRVIWVEVGPEVVAGSLTSVAQLASFAAVASPTVLDCPIVPEGSTARTAHNVTPLQPRRLLYRGQPLTCLEFPPALVLDNERVPTSPIYVTFATEAGPAGGFRTEAAQPAQTHNVVFSVPGDGEYSPLWAVHIYDRAAFDRVHDANTALAAPLSGKGPLVNCPIVSVE